MIACFRRPTYDILRKKTVLISGGFTYFAYRVADYLGMDYVFSNTVSNIFLIVNAN